MISFLNRVIGVIARPRCVSDGPDRPGNDLAPEFGDQRIDECIGLDSVLSLALAFFLLCLFDGMRGFRTSFSIFDIQIDDTAKIFRQHGTQPRTCRRFAQRLNAHAQLHAAALRAQPFALARNLGGNARQRKLFNNNRPLPARHVMQARTTMRIRPVSQIGHGRLEGRRGNKTIIVHGLEVIIRHVGIVECIRKRIVRGRSWQLAICAFGQPRAR